MQVEVVIGCSLAMTIWGLIETPKEWRGIVYMLMGVMILLSAILLKLN